MTHHAIAQMHKFNKEFANAKDCYKKMRTWHLNSKDKSIFYPVQLISLLDTKLMINYQLSSKDPNSTQGRLAVRQINALHLFGTWRNTLGIYQLDKDIIADSAKSPVPDDTPTSIFRNLPEWCVYLDLSHADFEVDTPYGIHKLYGFWAVFDKYKFDKTFFALNIIIDLNTDDDLYVPISMPIDDSLTIKEALDKMNDALNDKPDLRSFNDQKQMLQFYLSFLLWLCVAEPDIILHGEPISREQISKSHYATTKKNKEMFIPPNEPRFYDVGSRLGGEVRHYRQLINDDKQTRSSSRKRPHIRRGHWHGHWHGTGQAKEFKVKWQPAVFVNAS